MKTAVTRSLLPVETPLFFLDYISSLLLPAGGWIPVPVHYGVQADSSRFEPGFSGILLPEATPAAAAAAAGSPVHLILFRVTLLPEILFFLLKTPSTVK